MAVYRFLASALLKMTTVHEHEYFKMMRAREDRIRTFMQLELEACLEEVSWSMRCYNCEVLGCPQEEYLARLLPTLPPNYEDNLQSRLIMAQKGIFPASLKMILKSEYQLPILLMYLGNLHPGYQRNETPQWFLANYANGDSQADEQASKIRII